MSIRTLTLTLQEQVLIWKNKLFGTRRRQLAILLVVIIVCLTVGIIIVLASRPPRGQINCKKDRVKVCLLRDAKDELVPEKINELGKTVKEIQSLKNYKFDQDLMYVVTIYYVNMSDGVNAKVNYDQLESIYNANIEFSSELGKVPYDINQLKQSVLYLQDNAAHIQNQVQYGTPWQ